MRPRYPKIHVTVRSRNPMALVGAVRMALRRAGIGARQIHRFSDLAMASPDPQRLQRVCDQWVDLDAPSPQTGNHANSGH